MRPQISVNDTVAWLADGDDRNAVAGNAFLISPNIALTCAHVIRDHLALGKPTPRQLPTGVVRLNFQGLGIQAEARVVPSGWWPGGGNEEVDDVAVLELTAPLGDLKTTALASFAPADEMDCVVFGAPGGYQTTGKLVYARLAANPSWGRWQLYPSPGRISGYFVQQGFSGAPVLDLRGNVAWGMIASVDAQADTLVAFAIPAASLQQAIASFHKAMFVAYTQSSSRTENKKNMTQVGGEQNKLSRIDAEKLKEAMRALETGSQEAALYVLRELLGDTE